MRPLRSYMNTVFTTFLFVFIFISIHAQDYSGITKTHMIQSKVFDAERQVDVFIPSDYEERKDSLTLLIVFDAQFEPYFDMVADMAYYLSAIGEFDETIVVGIHTYHRPKEFTPVPTNPKTRENWGETPIGEGPKLEAYLKTEVMPLVNENYRCGPITIGIGHSLGGLFVTNAAFNGSELFNGVISISPNMVYDYGQPVNRIDSVLKSDNHPRVFHYMTAGDVGRMENSFRSGAEKADSIYQANPSEKVIWHYAKYEGKNHSLTPMYSIGDGLRAFYNFWNISDATALRFVANNEKTFAEQVEEHLIKKEEWLGKPLPPLSSTELNGLGYLAANEDRWDEALTIFEYAIGLHPDDANLYDSRGEALENMEKIEEAHKSYSKALKVLAETKDSISAEDYEYYLETFTANKERTSKLK